MVGPIRYVVAVAAGQIESATNFPAQGPVKWNWSSDGSAMQLWRVDTGGD
jgi:hypothetical protein